MNEPLGWRKQCSVARQIYLRTTNARIVTISTSTSEFTSHPDRYCYSASSHSRKLHMDMNNHATIAGVSFGCIHTEWGGPHCSIP